MIGRRGTTARGWCRSGNSGPVRLGLAVTEGPGSRAAPAAVTESGPVPGTGGPRPRLRRAALLQRPRRPRTVRVGDRDTQITVSASFND
eukprot:87832-Hanusia_phi.AAC.3